MSQKQQPRAQEHIVERHQGLVRRTVLVSVFTLLSRVMGYVREAAGAWLFGDVSAVNDAFVTAWRVPNLFRRLLGEGALSTSLQAALTEEDHESGLAAGRHLFQRTVRLTAWILLVLCGLLMLSVWLAPTQMPLTGWAWLGRDPEAMREMTLRLTPFVIFVCLSALISGALQTRGEFKVSSFAPAMLNLVWIAALGVLFVIFDWSDGGPKEPVAWRLEQLEMARVLAWAVLVSGVLQLAVQLPALRRHELLGGVECESRRSASDVLRQSLPLALGAAVYQVNVAIDGVMAGTMLSPGGATTYNLATRLQQFPVALIAVAATAAVFPSIKALGHLQRRAELRALHDRTQLAVVFLALPACIGLMVFAEPICEVLFQRGKFGPEGVARTAAALRVLSLAILPAGAVGLLSRAYYGMGDLRTPMRISIVMVLLNVLLNLGCLLVLELDTVGLALGTAATSWLNLFWLWPGLRTKLGLPAAAPGFLRHVSLIAVLALGSCGLGWLVYLGLHSTGSGPGSWQALTALFAGLASAAGLYVGAGFALRLPEAQRLRQSLPWRRAS